MEQLVVASLADRPDLVGQWHAIDGAWPAFMEQDPISTDCYDAARDLFPDLHLIALLNGQPAARLHAVPIPWTSPHELSDRGWDWALSQAVSRPTNDRHAVSLIEIRIQPHLRGQGLSHHVLAAAKQHLAALGTTHLVGPVRPNGKATEPFTPAADYATRQRPDGLPVDNWLRVHVRAGGRIVKVAPLSMTIPGTLDQWRSWTGLPFTDSGVVEVPGALAPVHVDTANDHAVYVEPNIWIHHPLR